MKRSATRRMLEYFKSNLWLLPSVIVLLSITAAFTLLYIDKQFIGENLNERWPLVFGAGSDGARQMLSTIAGSVITVAGVAFSITIVVLSLASSQYSPRVLRNFMGDLGSQAVLGGFLGIFAYCLVVLRTVRGGERNAFVPTLAISGSVLLALLAIGLVIFFVHHIATSIRATSIVRSVYQDTIAAVLDLYPAPCAGPAERYIFPCVVEWSAINSQKTGYIQKINLHQLANVARDKRVKVKTEARVGSFVADGAPLAWSSEQLDEQASKKIRQACVIGDERTLEQDVSFGIRQLVDVALKGLSPSLNDTTTAIYCIDHLGSIIWQLADRRVEPVAIFDGDELRVLAQGLTFPDFLAHAFDQIRQNGERNPAVLLRILRSLEMILPRARRADHIHALERQVSLIRETADICIPQRDRSEIESALMRFPHLGRPRKSDAEISASINSTKKHMELGTEAFT